MAATSDAAITLMAGGDIGPVVGPTEKFAEFITPVLAQADLRFGQCERTYSKRGWEPQFAYGPGGQHTRLDPSMAGIWKAANMDVVSLASNHMMDWGPEPVLDTIDLFWFPIDKECLPPHGMYQFPTHCRRTMVAKAVISGKGIEKVSFLPAFINPQAQPYVVGPADPKFQEILEWT